MFRSAIVSILFLLEIRVILTQYTCQSGQISNITCKSGLLGRKTCDNRTLSCEGNAYCCLKSSRSTTRTSAFTGSTVVGRSSTISSIGECSKCDKLMRHSCFLSIRNNTAASSSACTTCQNCCGDAETHSCEIWKAKSFCNTQWYSKDCKKILCGKTCGLCGT